MGEIQEGESVNEDIEVENTGDIEITSVSVSSEDYDVATESVSLEPDSSEEITIEFSEVESESGQVTLTAETESEAIEKTIDVSASVIPDYITRADDLEQRAIDLDSQISSDSDYQEDLNEAQSRISDIRTAYNRGNYDEAESLYSQVQSSLDDIEVGIRSSSSTGGDDNTSQTGNNSGGLPILPIAAAILVLLIIGFVAYTSIEFERGDPLYNVLG